MKEFSLSGRSHASGPDYPGILEGILGGGSALLLAAEVDLLKKVFSPGIGERSLWQRRAAQTARIMEPFLPGILGHGRIRAWRF